MSREAAISTTGIKYVQLPLNGAAPDPKVADLFLVAVADAKNTRRRADQEVERARKFGVEAFAKDVLAVADNLGQIGRAHV